MIIGTHTLIFSKDPAKDRAFLRDVLGFGHVDAGGGWLIFALPPAEMGVHPTTGDGRRWEVCLMTDDVEAEIVRLEAAGCVCAPIVKQDYGLVTRLTLPGGAELDLYEPTHEMAITIAR